MKSLPLYLLLGIAWLAGTAQALTIAQSPLFIAATEPRVMLTLSRDHQLSIKAYTDYSDLNGDGVLDITYNDAIDYYGYFDTKKCYGYSSGVFSASGSATGTHSHHCSGAWSGNFMNWASMTRMDVLRKVLYGGLRYKDTTGASGETILERHFLPRDVHAFVKTYNPGSSATLSLYMPASVVGANTSISLCNASEILTGTYSNLTGTAAFWPETFASSTTHPAPKIKVAGGLYPQWASAEITQCEVGGAGTNPAALLGESAGYTVRVKVCATTPVENGCKDYINPGTGVVTTKPTGLLQTYGDLDAERPVRFGLMTGTYGKNKSGGVLRKNTGYLTERNGACGSPATNYEIDNCTGAFINQGDTGIGIINALSRLRIAGYKTNSDYYNNGSNSCGYGVASFSEGNCWDWGSPMSEIYLEALRYFSTPGSGVTAAFSSDDTGKVAGLNKESTWNDPLPSSEWCAISSIVVLSTGLNSFDGADTAGTHQLADFTPASGTTAVSAASLTKTVGDLEGITGHNYLIGMNGTDNNQLCTAKTVSDLFNARGLCPEFSNGQGGFGIAGLAYAPKSMDLRPGYATHRQGRWTGINQAWVDRQPINTYAVQLAESLPSFTVNAGASGKVSILPYCTSGANASTGLNDKTLCSMNNLFVDANVAMASVGSDTTAQTNTCSGDGSNSACFTIAWEDSSWGGDYDMDGMQRLGYCVGSACDTFKMLCPSNASASATVGPWTGVASDQVVIAACAIQANSGAPMMFGFSVSGTTADGAYKPINRPAGAGSVTVATCDVTKNYFLVGCKLPNAVTAATATTFTSGTSAAGLLKNPLWYTAKYGGFTDSNSNNQPDLQSEWDSDSDGIPDNYYDVRNPANLITAMAEIIDAASEPDASAASVATNSTNLQIESRVYQAKFSSADWSGQLLQYRILTNGTLGASSEWDAGAIVNTQNYSTGRAILTKGTSDGEPFLWANLTSAQQTHLNKTAAGVADALGSSRVDYLRGSASNEGTTGTTFRKRDTSKLGDIVNSSPWYVGIPNAGYSDVDHPGYSAFRSANVSRKPVVYVGANDGMLHGFDASLDYTTHSYGDPTSTSGREILAYVPTPIYPTLPWLTDRKYKKNHRYFVDGSVMVGDVDLDSTTGTDWRTVLVGSMDGGGKGYYALDVTDPANFSQTNAADILLWEFTPSDDADVGNAYNRPPAKLTTNQPKQLVRMANGKWAAILGNGYNSTNGKAALYILFIEDGIDGAWTLSPTADYIKLVADMGPDNGLSTPVPFDSNGDGIVDVVYAGDLKGHVWKFLVGPTPSDASVTTNPATWKVAFSTSSCASTTPSTCVPLFSAVDSSSNMQPITWPPEVSLHPDYGLLVLVGTGKFIESGDLTTTNTQTFYGIWDRNTTAGTVVSRTDLLAQTATDSTIGGIDYRTNSNTSLTWREATCATPYATNCPGTYMGWYFDMPATGERLTGVPKLDNGVIYFNTYIPSASVCDQGGTGWLMALQYDNGSALDYPIFDTSASGSIGADDTIVSGVKVGAALGGTTLIRGVGAGSTGIGVSSLSSGAMETMLINFGAGARGRITWRELAPQ